MPILGVIASSIFKVTITGAGYSTGVSGGIGRNINKLAFASETTSQIAATLTFGNGYLTGMGNWGVAGYTGQGASPSFGNTGINKLIYSSETNSLLGAGTTFGQAAASCSSNAGVKGFWTAGYNGSYQSGGSKITYSTDSTTTGPSCSFGTNSEGMGSSNPAVAGYNNGGFPNGNAQVEKLTFSTESMSNLGSRLTGNMRTEPGAINNGAVSSFVFGGDNSNFGGGASTTIQKMPFSTETYSNLAATMSTGNPNSNGYALKAVAGYLNAGGTQVIDRLAFATDTRTTLLATATTAQSNCGNSSYDITI
jgi:hypothetical protein